MAENSLPIVSARDAYDAGKTRFFTGKPCTRGHIAERMVSNGSCVECLKLKSQRRKERYIADPERRQKNYENIKTWRKANPDKRAEESKRYAAKHPETQKRATEKYRATHMEEIREQDRWAHIRKRRINPEAEKARMDRWRDKQQRKLELLAGRPKPDLCEICGEFHLRIVFDHCHASGEFRGWLCDRCNRVLGIVKDSPELLLALRDYLKGVRHGEESRDDGSTPKEPS